MVASALLIRTTGQELPTMPIVRASKVLVRFAAALAAAALVSGCVGGHLSSETPPGAGLQGVWKLNRSDSDDPGKIIDTLRAEAQKKIRRAMNAAGQEPMTGERDGSRRRGRGGVDSGEQQAQAEDFALQHGPGTDPLRTSPTMHALRDILQRGDYLTIRESPEEVSFDYGTTVRSYTPGVHSVVSSENGVADQTSGWSGKQYVIHIRPQIGPAIVEEYALSPDGRHLIVKSHIGPFELSKVNLTRVYDQTGAVVPNSGPSNE
jgi:hypothetical protein